MRGMGMCYCVYILRGEKKKKKPLRMGSWLVEEVFNHLFPPSLKQLFYISLSVVKDCCRVCGQKLFAFIPK